MKDRRFIEETFPVKEVSAESAREKSIRHGHISTLHIWWARRPLASSRSTSYAALIPAPSDATESSRLRDFIINLCKWENSLNQKLIERAREDISQANRGRPPRILDPFAGGGAIPLEALRLGCEVYSSDSNPVAVLIQKCTLEYPQKYRNARKGEAKWAEMRGSASNNLLLDDVEKWGKWVLADSKNEISQFYPTGPDGSIPVGYIWARTVPCQNPSCASQIPLMQQYWLANKPNRSISVLPVVQGNDVSFKIVGDGYTPMPTAFQPKKGSVSKAIATCLICGSSVDGKTMRKLSHTDQFGERMIAVVSHRPGKGGKSYRVADHRDESVFAKAEIFLEKKVEKLREEWGIEPVPDEPIEKSRPSPNARGLSSITRYTIEKWSDLFNTRQKLVLITLIERIRQAHQLMLREGYDEEYAKAVVSYLAIALDRLANQYCCIARWDNVRETIEGGFSRQALAMVWDYVELNPQSGATGDWGSAMDWILKVIRHASETSEKAAEVSQSSATALRHPDNFFDAVLTDPPYYDNVPYAYLSDFFYVWLKRTVGHLYPDLFSTPLTPKSGEIVAYSNREGGWEAGKRFYEEALKKAFQEVHRVLAPGGIAVIVYAHKSTEGWETLINSLLSSGLVITGAWPLRTEFKARIRAQGTASLASSIYIITRKMQREPTGFYNEVKEELKKHLNGKLDRLWREGVSGADFFIAAIGSAIEVFGRYESVMDYEGTIIRADRLLDDVREIATDYAVRQILHNGFGGEISDLTRLYVLWRWEFGEVKVPFDDARKLAQSCGIDLSKEWSRNGFVRKETEFVRLIGPQERIVKELENSPELVDILHLALLLWEKGKRDDMARVLSESGFGRTEAFFRVAQAVSETLPNESKEKKLLDGFLAGRERVHEEIKKKAAQTKLI